MEQDEEGDPEGVESVVLQSSFSLFVGRLLADSSGLRSLNLSSCRIEGSGVTTIASALLQNHTLTELRLAGNRVDEVAGRGLAMVISADTPLRSLNLRHTGLGRVSLILFLYALGENTNISTLSVDGGVEEGCEDGVDAIDENMAVRNSTPP